MQEPRASRRPMSSIGGWMIGIAVFGGILGALVLNPFLFVLVVFVGMEAMAFARFRRLRHRQMSGWAETLWVFGFVIVIPVISVIASCVALFAYCSVNPGAYL